jgi:hypothetical protein
MSQNNVWKKAHYLLVGILILSFVVLVSEIFIHYDDAVITIDATVPTAEIMEPKLVITNGISNDLGTILGPWWITSPIANFQITNSTQRTFRAHISLSIGLGFCQSERKINLTFQNRTKDIQLGTSRPTDRTDLNFDVFPEKIYNLTLEVIGPVCQIDTDPRLFLGEVKMNRVEFVGKNEFLFK